MSQAAHELVIATGNPHKVDELSAIFASDLAALGVRLVGLRDLEARGMGPFHEPEETGATFDLNAAIKARSYAQQTGMACLADDSGLEIDALDGRPGVISSHYFNNGRTDGAAAGMGRAERDRLNIDRVLDELSGVAFEARSARFVCVMAAAGHDAPGDAGRPADRLSGPSDPLAGVRLFRGAFEGCIGLPAWECPPDRPERLVPRGAHGFGYDPVFLVGPDHVRTSAELGPAEKNRVSHRARAAELLGAWLRAGGVHTLAPSRDP